MTSRIGTVVKVGGSLFELPDLGDRILEWIASSDLPSPVLLIAGCGELGNTIRSWQLRHDWTDERSHEMCLDLLDVSAAALDAMLRGPSTDDLQRPAPAPVFVFRPRKWLREVEPTAGGRVLPANWRTTTDSIAARIAECVGALELVLLKSTLPATSAAPRARQLQDWSDAGIVDGHFLLAAVTAKISLVNLKDDAFPQLPLNDQ